MGSQYFSGPSQVMLTVTNGGTAPVTGNIRSYQLAYRWNSPSSYTQYNLAMTTTSCATVAVTEINSQSTFNAFTFLDRPQVSCGNNMGGTSYERQFLGFNSGACYGVCGTDPAQSNGMVVWYGSGYTPSTSGGLSDPARAASMAFWVRSLPSVGNLGTQGNPALSCKAILNANPGSSDGAYWIYQKAVAVRVYCDMTTDGGGWTLVSYSYKHAAIAAYTSMVYLLPNTFHGDWDPFSRNQMVFTSL